MSPSPVSNSGLALVAVAAVLVAAVGALDLYVRSAAERPVTVAVTGEPPSPYAPFAAVLEPRKALEAYRAETAASATYAAGRTAYAAGRYAEAEEAFGRALGDHPGNLMVLNQLGLVARRAGRPDSAEARWRRALDADSAYTPAALNLGLLYGERGAWAEAEASYRLAIRFNPFYGRAHSNLGLFLLHRGRADEAAAVLEHAASLTSGSARARALNGLGRARLALGDGEGARGAFTEAIALQPDYVSARVNLADTYPSTEEGRAARREALGAVARLKSDAPARALEWDAEGDDADAVMDVE